MSFAETVVKIDVNDSQNEEKCIGSCNAFFEFDEFNKRSKRRNHGRG
jgi:hypothetical protein